MPLHNSEKMQEIISG